MYDDYSDFAGTGDFEPDCEGDYDCPGCDERQDRLDDAAEYFSIVLKQLYQEAYDENRLQSHLETLAEILDIHMPKGRLNVRG